MELYLCNFIFNILVYISLKVEINLMNQKSQNRFEVIVTNVLKIKFK